MQPKPLNLLARMVDLSENTQRAYVRNIRDYLAAVNQLDRSDIRLDSLDLSLIVSSLTLTKVEGWLDQKAKQTGQQSLEQAKAALIWMTQNLMEDEYVDPLTAVTISGAKTPKAEAGKERPRVLLSPDEFKTLLNTLPTLRSPYPARMARDMAMVLLLATGGLRRAEVAGLNWEHIIISEGACTLQLTGRKRPSEVNLPEMAVAAIEKWRTYHPLPNPQVPVFTRVLKNGSVTKARITDKGVWLAAKDVLLAAGFPNLSPDDLRLSLHHGAQEVVRTAQDLWVAALSEEVVEKAEPSQAAEAKPKRGAVRRPMQLSLFEEE